MSWQLLVALSVISNATSILIVRSVASKKDTDPIAYAIAFQFITGLLILGFALYRGVNFSGFGPLLYNFVFMGIIYAIANYFKFQTLNRVEASEFIILFQSSAIWSILLAVVLLGESFSFKNVLGTALIIGSVFLVTNLKDRLKLGKGEILALVTALCYGIAFANDVYILRQFDVYTFSAVAFLTPATITSIAFPKSASLVPQLIKSNSRKIFLSAALYAAAAIFIYTAYKIGKNAAHIAPLNNTVTIVTVLLGIIFLKERADIDKKVIAALVSFAGILLLA